MIIELLLLFIAIAEGVRLISLLKKRGKKEYFKGRLQGVEQEIWQTEFMRHKAKEVKEGLRVEMTALKSKQGLLEESIKGHEEKKDLPEGEIARLKDEDIKLEVKINKIIYGIGMPKLKDDKSVDEEETDKFPRETDLNIKDMDRQLGFLNEKIDSLHELKGMIKEFVKKEI